LSSSSFDEVDEEIMLVNGDIMVVVSICKTINDHQLL
jgi:hypothetical protein